jgi:putative (di)nucleoside polyphosphate hydrolase
MSAGAAGAPGSDIEMTNDIIDSDGFRANVGIVLMRRDGAVFLGRRTGGKGWQFPQGGIREGERLEQALYRELREEIGLAQADVELVGSTARWLRYRLPPRYIRRDRQPLCIGQKQRWFLLRLAREPAAFDFTSTGEEPEFDGWRWAQFWEPAREVIYFKRKVYQSALVELAPAAFPAGQPALPAWWNTLTRGPADTAGTRSGGA